MHPGRMTMSDTVPMYQFDSLMALTLFTNAVLFCSDVAILHTASAAASCRLALVSSRAPINACVPAMKPQRNVDNSRSDTAEHSTAGQYTAQQSIARQSAAWHGMAQHGMAQHGTSTIQHCSCAQCDTAQQGKAKHSTTKHSMT